MWICLNDAFVSAVENRDDASTVYVRARRRQHLENFLEGFPERDEIFSVEMSDYAWRAIVSKKNLAHILINKAFGIQYHNFKDSVEDPHLKKFYSGVWWDGLFMTDTDNELTKYYKGMSYDTDVIDQHFYHPLDYKKNKRNKKK